MYPIDSETHPFTKLVLLGGSNTDKRLRIQIGER